MSGSKRKRIEITVQTPDGASWAAFVEYRQRPDGRFEAWLSFEPERDGATVTTTVQTTQSAERDVFNWASALSIAHVENAFTNAVAPVRAHDGGISSVATPLRPDERLQHLRPIERDVLDVFSTRRTTTIPTREIFERGPHANADFVRAFEDLEKQWRYLVRRTVGGVDYLELTMDGARALGIPAEPGGEVELELPRGSR